MFLGRAGEAETRLLTAMRLNPHYNWAPVNFLGMAYYQQERYREAAQKLDEAAALNPGFIGNMIWRAAAHALLGNDEIASEIAAQIRTNTPNWSISNTIVQIRDPGAMERLNFGLRKAGLPD
ncbi:MAG: tetratricopeptide repeat protein [Sedimentitalea sp.]